MQLDSDQRDPIVVIVETATALNKLPIDGAPLIADWLLTYVAEGSDAAGDLYSWILGTENESGRSRRAEAAREGRNRLLREAADRFDLSAAELANRCDRYATDAWPRTRTETANPHPADSLEALFWAAMRYRAGVPGAKRMRHILQGSRLLETSVDEL